MKASLIVFLVGSTLTRAALAQSEPHAPEGAVRTEEPLESAVFRFEGQVLGLQGAPAEGAVVVSSAGGSATTDAHGAFRLEVEAPLDAEALQITAVGRAGSPGFASTQVRLAASSGTTWVGPLALSQGGECSPAWLPTFGGEPGIDNDVYALAVYDEGSGPRLFAGGYFNYAGGAAMNSLARWDGSSWSEVGGGLDGNSVNALLVYDDGSGEALYVGGEFATAGGAPANRVARWDGESWSAVGTNLSGVVKALIVHDDGSGPTLFASGTFTTGSGGSTPNHIAKWDGSSWLRLRIGTGGDVNAMAVYDEGNGPMLFAGGAFHSAGLGTAYNVARWNGNNWSAVGVGLDAAVRALAVYDDGSGPALYAGGDFTLAGGEAAIARWDGSTWSPVGSGLGDGFQTTSVYAMSVCDIGSGPALHVVGEFQTAGGVSANRVARWDGTSWTTLGSGMDWTINALTAYDDGSGPGLVVGGRFDSGDGRFIEHIARWDGASWDDLGTGLNNWVNALAVYDDGSGPALHAGGRFSRAGGVPVHAIAKRNGTTWIPLGGGLKANGGTGIVYSLAVLDDGAGPALYAGGLFDDAGGVAARNIAKWDGVSWTALGSGVDSTVHCLAVYDDGSGPAIYAGGTLSGVGGGYIARWDGTSWTPLGSGANGGVFELKTYDDGNGSALYAGGGFTTMDGVAVNYIARWSGAGWSALGSGMSSFVGSLATFDDGSGEALYAGGGFSTAGGTAAMRIAKWDGATWMPLGNGLARSVLTLLPFDDGSGPCLFAGVSTVGATPQAVVKWDGVRWTELGSGMNGNVQALIGLDDGSGNALYAGGTFRRALDSGDSYLARWVGCEAAPTLHCPPYVVAIDKSANGDGEIVHFTVTASDFQPLPPTVVCSPPSGSFFPRGRTLVSCTATGVSGLQSTCEFEVMVYPKIRPR